MTNFEIGILGIVLFLILLFIKVPIAVAMGLIGLAGFSYLVNPAAAMRMVGSDFFAIFSSYSLSVITMFVFMGFLAFYAGLGNKLYALAYKTVGFLPGGLAMASEVACAVFGAVCGSSTATAATIGSIAIPEMKKYNYDSSLSTACVAAGGAIGILIPPSVIFVIYGVATEQSISRLFLAGIFPGILLTLFYMAAILIVTKRNPALGPPAAGPRPPLKEILIDLPGGLLEVVIVFVIAIGGLFAGWFTPTEAGGVGAVGIFIVTLALGHMNFTRLNNALKDTTRTVAMIFFLVAGATMFTRFFAVTRVPFEIARIVEGIPLPPVYILVLILLLYFVLGTIIEMIPLILLTIPIFYPVVVQTLGYDPIWFGVIIVMVVAIGVITPPVGVNVYVIKGVAKDIPLEVIFRGTLPFIIASVLCVVIMIIFPQIATFLPQLMM